MDSVLRGVACSRPSYILVPVVFVYRAEQPNIIIIIAKLDVVDAMNLRHQNRRKANRQLRLLTLIIGAS